MLDETITFQLATQYLSKIALRLECLFLTISQSEEEKHPVIHHYALKNVIEILKLSEKPELKSRFLKEFMRIEYALHKSYAHLSEYLQHQLQQQVHYLNQTAGRFGEGLHRNNFLQSIRLSQTGDQTDCELHTPQLLFWLEHAATKRQQDLADWVKQLKPLRDTVTLYLSLLRSTATYDHIDLLNGFYQQTLPTKHSCHLILLRMNKYAGLVPQMQLGHHGLSLRLCEAHSMEEIRHSRVPVSLAICQL